MVQLLIETVRIWGQNVHTAEEKQAFREVGRNMGPELEETQMVQDGFHVALPQLSYYTLKTKLHFLSFLEDSESEHIFVGSHSHFRKILPDVIFFSYAHVRACACACV